MQSLIYLRTIAWAKSEDGCGHCPLVLLSPTAAIACSLTSTPGTGFGQRILQWARRPTGRAGGGRVDLQRVPSNFAWDRCRGFSGLREKTESERVLFSNFLTVYLGSEKLFDDRLAPRTSRWWFLRFYYILVFMAVFSTRVDWKRKSFDPPRPAQDFLAAGLNRRCTTTMGTIGRRFSFGRSPTCSIRDGFLFFLRWAAEHWRKEPKNSRSLDAGGTNNLRPESNKRVSEKKYMCRTKSARLCCHDFLPFIDNRKGHILRHPGIFGWGYERDVCYAPHGRDRDFHVSYRARIIGRERIVGQLSPAAID